MCNTINRHIFPHYFEYRSWLQAYLRAIATMQQVLALLLWKLTRTHTVMLCILAVVEWTTVKKQRYLGVPKFLGYGQHKKGDKDYRFLVIQHLSTDLQKIFEQNGRSFSEKTTFGVGLRMVCYRSQNGMLLVSEWYITGLRMVRIISF